MSVVPPSPQTDTDERTLDERVTELEALIEEARQRARRRRRRNAAVAVAALLAAGAAAYAGGDGIRVGAARSADGDAVPAVALDRARARAWTVPTGPPGFPADIHLDPSRPGTLYVSVFSSGRVFRSTTGGRSWSSGRPAASRIDALAVDPRNGSVIYAGTGDGVLKSTDAGRTWRDLGLTPPPARRSHAQVEGWVWSVQFDPLHSRIVYARTYEGVSSRTFSGLYRSANGGVTWRPLRGAPPGLGALVIDPSTPTTLYAAIVVPGTEMENRGAIMRSTDSGRTWRTVARPDGKIFSFAVDPARPGTIWAAGRAGVLVTRDGGTTWLEAGRPTAGNLDRLIVDPTEADTLYVSTWEGGLFRSTDGGRSWQPFAAGRDLDGLAIDPRAPGTMYAADGRGVVKTTDGGATWRRAEAGIVASTVNAVASAPGRPATIYAGGSSGLSRSDDRGRTWTVLRARYGVSLAVDPRDPRHVLAGARGIEASRDGGATWVDVFAPSPGDEVHAIAFDPRDPRWVYAATDANGLLRSSDGGATWKYLQRGDLAPALAVHPDRGGTVFSAGGRGSFAVSTDHGDSWRYSSIPRLADVRSIAVAPSDPDTLYAFSDRGLPGAVTRFARSTDGGGHWRVLTARGLGIQALVVDPERSRTVYAGTGGRGILRSTDGGASWRPFGKRLPSRSISTLVFDATGTVLYAGTNGAGLTSIRVR